MREVTIFSDIMTDIRMLHGHYLDEPSLQEKDEDGNTIWQHPIQTFVWNELDPTGKRNPCDGSPACIRHEFHYVATNTFKEKFKVFFEQMENLKRDKTKLKYDLETERTLRYSHQDVIYKLNKRIDELEDMGFWKRLKFLFGGEV